MRRNRICRVAGRRRKQAFDSPCARRWPILARHRASPPPRRREAIAIGGAKASAQSGNAPHQRKRPTGARSHNAPPTASAKRIGVGVGANFAAQTGDDNFSIAHSNPASGIAAARHKKSPGKTTSASTNGNANPTAGTAKKLAIGEMIDPSPKKPKVSGIAPAARLRL